MYGDVCGREISVCTSVCALVCASLAHLQTVSRDNVLHSVIPFLLPPSFLDCCVENFGDSFMEIDFV